MQKLIIATGQSRMSKLWKNTEISWSELQERLKTTTRTTETQGEYNNMTKSQQDDQKDVGGFIGGKVKNGRRKAESIDKRYILTLDADFAGEDFCDAVSLFYDVSWCVYSTHKHTPEKPRLRLLIPLSRACNPDEYEAIARQVASDIGMERFDDTTYQAHRLMYWPSTSIDGDYYFQQHESTLLDVDQVLAKYEDWQDISSWPTSSRTTKTHERLLKRQEDPTEKRGIVGAFCRSYTIGEAINAFLSTIYSQCTTESRYTYVEGSTAAGLVVYEEGKFAYSNHATDPCGGLLCNAFDLVRLHKFGVLDDDITEGTPIAKLPSYVAMLAWASEDEGVKRQLYQEKMATARADFAGITTPDQEQSEAQDDDWALALAVDAKGRYAATIDNVKKIMIGDPHMRKKIRFNDFTKKCRVFGVVPWENNPLERDWVDSDDAGFRHYIEKTYGIKGKGTLEDAWTLVSNENKYHPVRDYLNGLSWDGVERLDTLFIDYLGAEDNDYVRAVTGKSLIAAVARVFEPGIKHDTMLVLVGPQGCGKSQMIKRLGHDWFSDTLTTMQGKEAYEQLQGFWLIEVGELAAMKKMEVEAVKMFVSKSEDAYRAAYGHHVETYKRQCVFFGTTNTHEFLRDGTGNRRFWPVDVEPGRATKNLWQDLDEETVGLVWAEAVQRYKQGGITHIDDERLRLLAEAEQEHHLEESPMAGNIRLYLEKLLPEGWDDYDLSARRMYYQGSDFGVSPEGTIKREKVCALEIWCEMFNGEKKDLNSPRSKEIKDIVLKSGQWEQMKYPMRFGALYGNQRGFILKN